MNQVNLIFNHNNYSKHNFSKCNIADLHTHAVMYLQKIYIEA